MAALVEDDAALPGGVYRVAIIGDQRTGKTEFLKWFFESVENKGKVEHEHIMVGEFIRESDYVRVEGSLHRFQSAFNSDQLREDWKGRYSSKYERKAILQRKNFNKRYRATVSPLFYDLPLCMESSTVVTKVVMARPPNQGQWMVVQNFKYGIPLGKHPSAAWVLFSRSLELLIYL